MFSQLLVNGLIAGAIYALVASGFFDLFSSMAEDNSLIKIYGWVKT